MGLVDELYKALDRQEKERVDRKLAEIKELEEQEKNAEDMSEEELMDLIRRIMIMQNLSREERNRRIQELLGQAGDKREDLEAMVRVEQLRMEAENNHREAESLAPKEERPAFSYSSGGGSGSRYAGGPKEEEERGGYRKLAGEKSEFEELANKGFSEFEKARHIGTSQFDEIAKKELNAYASEQKEEEEPSSNYEGW